MKRFITCATFLAILLATAPSAFALGWQLPTGNSDEGDASTPWTNLPLACDAGVSLPPGDSSTWASNGGSNNVPSWGNFADFTFPAAYCDSIGVYADFGAPAVDYVQVDVWNTAGAAWVTVCGSTPLVGSSPANGVIANDSFVTIAIAPMTISKMRFRFHYYTGGWNYWVYTIAYHSIPPVIVSPTITTLNPILDLDSAAFQGQIVDDGGAECTISFEWGSTTAYGNTTTPQPGYSTGMTGGTFLGGLTTGTQYHCRLNATNSAGTTHGNDIAFTPIAPHAGLWVVPTGGNTDSTPPSPSTGSWQNIQFATDDDDSTSATLYVGNGDASPGPYLYLTHAAISCDAIRVKADLNPNITAMEISVNQTVGGWTVIYNNNTYTNQQWLTVPFASTTVTGVRVRFSHVANVGFTIGVTDCNFHLPPGPDSQLAITSVNGGANPTAGTPFNVIVQSQDSYGNPSNVVVNTAVTLSLNSGGGTLGGTLSGTILAGTNLITVSGVTYTAADTATLTATEISGDSLTPGVSSPFIVNPGAAAKLQILLPGEVAAPGSVSGKTGAPTAQTAATAFNVKVNEVDANWNVVSSTDTVHLTSTNTHSLPANAALVGGTHTFSVTLNKSAGCTLTASDVTSGGITANTSPTLTVNARALTITAAANSRTYDGTASASATPSITSGSVAAGDTANFIESYDNKNAGSGHVMTPSGAVNDGNSGNNYSYAFVTSSNGTITPRAISVAATGPAKTYGTALVAGTSTSNFTAGATGVGSETVTSVTLTPDSAGLSATTAAGATYVVTPSLATGTGGFLEANYNVTYNAFTGTVGKKALTVTATGPAKTYGTALVAGTSVTDFTSSGEITGEQVTSVTLTPDSAGLSATTAAGATYVVTPSLATGTGGFLEANYNVSYNAFTDTVGQKALIVTATGPSKIYGSALVAGTSVTDFTSSGEITGEQVTSVTLTPDSAGLSATIAAGATYVVTPSLATGTGGFLEANYNVTYNAFTGTVGQKALTVTATGPVKTYGSALVAGTNTTDFTSSGEITGEQVTSVTLTPDSAGLSATTAAGATYVVTPSLATGSGGFLEANYNVTYNAFTSTVDQKALIVTATGPAKTYGTALAAGTSVTDFTSSGEITGEQVTSVTLTPDSAGLSAATAAGATYVVTPSLATGSGGFLEANYNVTYNAFTSTVDKKALTVTATGPAKTYGTALVAGTSATNFTSSGEITGEQVTSVTLTPDSAGLSATTAAGATYVVTPSLATGSGGFLEANYNVTYNAFTSTVSKKALTVTATGPAKTYGTALVAGTSVTDFTSSGEITGEQVTSVTLTPDSAGLSATTAAGATYVVMPSLATGSGGFLEANYNVTYNAFSGTVGKKALTVTATGPAKTYGTALVAGTSVTNFTSSGEVTGEQVTSVTLTPDSAGLSATTAAGATYVVTPSLAAGTGGFLEANYNVTYNPFTGTVGKKALTVTATGPTKTYGTALVVGTSATNFTSSGEITGELVTSVTLTPDSAGLSATTAAGATYVVTPSLATGSGGFLEANYNVTYNAFTGTVAKKALTVTATGPAKTYGTALVAGTSVTNFTSSGEITGEQVTSVTLTPDSAGLSATTAAGATYVVTPSLATGTGGFLEANYNVTYNAFTGTVGKRAITVTAVANTKPFDGTTSAAAVPTVTVGTLAAGDVGTLTESYDNAVPGTSHVLTPIGTIANAGNTDVTADYAITFATISTGIISKAGSTTALASSANPANLTSSVTITATVSSAGGTPTGTVTFTVDGTAQAPVTLAAGKAAFVSSTLTLGNHAITAAYSGDTNFAVSTSAALTQTINETTPPTVLSQPSAGTTTGTVGVPVTFTFGVSDPSQVTYTWDFGDGTAPVTTTGTNISHTFTAPGVYTIKGTATNAGGQSVSGTMTFTVAAAATAPGNLCTGLNPIPMQVQLVSAKLVFNAANKDSLGLKGVLALPDGFKVQGQQVQWEIGGIVSSATLDAKGNAKAGNIKASLKFKPLSKGAAFTARNGTITIGMKSQSLASSLTLGGIAVLNANNTNKTGDPATVEVCVVLTNVRAYHQDAVSGTYKAKKGKSGTFSAKSK